MGRFEDHEQQVNEYLRRCGQDPDEEHLWEAHEVDQAMDRLFEKGDRARIDQARREAFDERRVQNILRPRTGEVQVQPQSRAA